MEVECLIIFLFFLIELRNEILRVYLRGIVVLWREVYVFIIKVCKSYVIKWLWLVGDELRVIKV